MIRSLLCLSIGVALGLAVERERCRRGRRAQIEDDLAELVGLPVPPESALDALRRCELLRRLS